MAEKETLRDMLVVLHDAELGPTVRAEITAASKRCEKQFGAKAAQSRPLRPHARRP